MSQLEKLLTREEFAELVGLSMASAHRLYRLGLGPKCIRVGQKRVAYRPSDVAEWLKSREGLPENLPLPGAG